LYAFLSGIYRFTQHAKLYEHRFQNQQLQVEETAVPTSVEEVMEYALAVARQKPQPQASAFHANNDDADTAKAVWSGPLYSPSGYGEEGRHFLFALEEAGVPVAAQILPWRGEAALDAAERERLDALLQKPVVSGFVQIIQDFPPNFAGRPQAG